jgi:methylthioribose-1-phosphate isomerase
VPEPTSLTQPPSPNPVVSIAWDGAAPVIIDQRRLPDALVHWRLDTVDAVVEAIRTLAVRGAPAIGIAGGYGMVVGLDEAGATRLGPADRDKLVAILERLAAQIGAARPTAVNLSMAVGRVRDAALAAEDGPGARAAALAEATTLQDEDRASCAAIAANGRIALAGARRLLTHCNTGRLATAGDGTALAVVYAMHAAGELDEVLACESRPLLQGSRLTAWELGQAGVPYRLIVDPAAGAAMARGMVDAVVVGCDRVAANGDTANKVGTYSLAVLAREHGIPFWVAGPHTSFDLDAPDGASIVVEERDPAEVRHAFGHPIAPADAPAWNPAFDVTPAALIEGYITDVGIVRPPFGPEVRIGASGRDAVPARDAVPVAAR